MAFFFDGIARVENKLLARKYCEISLGNAPESRTSFCLGVRKFFTARRQLSETRARWYNNENLPKKVEQMYSEIWLPDRLDSEKWLSSLFSMRLNCNEEMRGALEWRVTANRE